jgi:hypothetical protein
MDIVFAAGTYVHWGVVSVSVTNLLIVVIMLAVFVLALLLPFPHEHGPRATPPGQDEEDPS